MTIEAAADTAATTICKLLRTFDRHLAAMVADYVRDHLPTAHRITLSPPELVSIHGVIRDVVDDRGASLWRLHPDTQALVENDVATPASHLASLGADARVLDATMTPRGSLEKRVRSIVNLADDLARLLLIEALNDAAQYRISLVGIDFDEDFAVTALDVAGRAGAYDGRTGLAASSDIADLAERIEARWAEIDAITGGRLREIGQMLLSHTGQSLRSLRTEAPVAQEVLLEEAFA